MSQGNNTVWDAAREYAKNGIYVFPVYVSRKPDGKKDVRPAGLWRDISSNSLADIGAWEQEHPDAGLGIDCGKSGLVVVDCDGPDGIANWGALEHGPAVMAVTTSSGGEHWYYRAHPDHPIGNDQNGKVAPSVDIRGLGGFVIAPPTTDGLSSWAVASVDWTSQAQVPAVVIERMTAKSILKPRESAPSAADALFDDAGQGEKRFTRADATKFIQRELDKLKTVTSGYNGAINNFALTCAHFPWLVDRAYCGRLVIKALGPSTGWTSADDDDMRTIESAYSAVESGKTWTAVEVGEKAEVAAADDRLRIQGSADMAYWLEENAGRGRLSGLFLRGGQMVHTPRIGEAGYIPAPEGENGPAEIRPLSGQVLAAKIQFAYRCFKIDKEGEESAALFPVEAAKRAVDAAEVLLGLRPLRGITSTPMVRADGSLISRPGYDEQSGFLFLPEDGINVPDVPERPGVDEVAAARELLLGMIADFPFATPDDRANYLGLLLTPLLRQVAPPSYKLFGIGAHQPGSGKSLLAELAGIIHGSVMRSEVPEDEAEWRKQSFSILSTTSAPLVVLDNIMGVLRSSTLAGLLTAGREVTDRELGSSRTITVANDRVWVVTGNNLSLGGDMVRRTITILIDPDTPHPEQRTDFRVADLAGWAVENRNRILHALLTLIQAWVVEGMPEPHRRQSDSFARWERVIAGVLAVAGIEGEFDNESGKRAARGGDDDGLAQVLEMLHGRFGDRAFTVGEALEPKEGEGWLLEQRDWLPSPVLDKLGRNEAAGRKALGWWFRNRVGRWVSDENGHALVIRDAGKDRTGAYWKIEAR